MSQRINSKADAYHNMELSKSNKMQLTYSEWEKKMIAEGYKYISVTTEIVPTLVFASPKRQAMILEENKLKVKK